MIGNFKEIRNKIRALKNNYKNKFFWKAIVTSYLGRLIYRKNNGFYVTSEYWDYLIILDACRYDYFAEEIARRKLQGKLEYRISRGTDTPSFLLENFGNREFKDIVYITANPYIDLLLKGKFYKIISVWKDGWDKELKTVHPRIVFEYTLEALKKYPDKRLIIHFIQPHYPYLTKNYNVKVGGLDYLRKNITSAEGKDWREVQTSDPVRLPIYDLVLNHYIPLEDVIEGYKENLKIVMDYVEKLVRNLAGKIVITADHGEAFGELLHPLIPIKVFEHPLGCRIDCLIKVPWFIIERDNEKKRKTKEEVMKIKEITKKIGGKLSS